MIINSILLPRCFSTGDSHLKSCSEMGAYGGNICFHLGIYGGKRLRLMRIETKWYLGNG